MFHPSTGNHTELGRGLEYAVAWTAASITTGGMVLKSNQNEKKSQGQDTVERRDALAVQMENYLATMHMAMVPVGCPCLNRATNDH